MNLSILKDDKVQWRGKEVVSSDQATDFFAKT